MRSLYISNFFAGIFFISILLGCKNIKSPSEDSTSGTGNVTGKDSSLEQKSLSQKYKLDKIILPEGFKIEVYAEVPNARSITLSPEGTLFVGTQKNSVYAIPDKNKDGKADKVYEIVSNIDAPNGVYLSEQFLLFTG